MLISEREICWYARIDVASKVSGRSPAATRARCGRWCVAVVDGGAAAFGAGPFFGGAADDAPPAALVPPPSICAICAAVPPGGPSSASASVAAPSSSVVSTSDPLRFCFFADFAAAAAFAAFFTAFAAPFDGPPPPPPPCFDGRPRPLGPSAAPRASPGRRKRGAAPRQRSSATSIHPSCARRLRHFARMCGSSWLAKALSSSRSQSTA